MKECVVSGFNASRTVILTSKTSDGREKVFEELEALLEQDSCQNQEELARSLGVTARSLGVSQQVISKRLKAMGKMIQKQGNWVPYELKPRDVERRLFIIFYFVCL